MTPHHHSVLSHLGDRFLALFLYGVTIFFVIWPVYVSLRPPKSKKSRFGNAALFLVVAFCGYIATNEQSQRQARAADEAAAARQAERKQDMEQREEDRKQNENLTSEMKGMRTAISDVAKASGNPKWGQLSSFLEGWSKVHAGAKSCVDESARPYKCKSNAELGRFLLDEVARIENLTKQSAAKDFAIHIMRPDQPEFTGSVDAMIRTERWRFTNEMKACCLADLELLRTEALYRLGPSAKSVDEQQHWDAMMSPFREEFFHWFVPAFVAEYLPYFDALGRDLLNKPEQN